MECGGQSGKHARWRPPALCHKLVRKGALGPAFRTRSLLVLLTIDRSGRTTSDVQSWRSLGAALLLASSLSAAPVRAQDAEPVSPREPAIEKGAEVPASGESDGQATAREQARDLGYSGVRAYAAGEYTAASEKLERAFALLPVPSLGLWSARALVKLGHFVDAEQRYRAVAKMRVDADAPEAQQAAHETAKAELLELLPRIPTLRVQIDGARPEEIAITLDGNALPIDRWSRGEPVDPGPHHLVGTRLAEQSAIDITANEGRENEVVLRFLSPSPPSIVAPLATPQAAASVPLGPAADSTSSLNPWKLGGWIAVGAGAGGLVLSAVSYFVARGKYDAMKKDGSCVDHTCQSSAELDSYDSWRSVQVVSLVAGVVVGGAGATILLLEPRLAGGQAAGQGEVGRAGSWEPRP